MSILPIDQAVIRFRTNDSIFDLFVNGNDTQVVETTSGQEFPSLAKFMADKDVDIDALVTVHSVIAEAAATTATTGAATATTKAGEATTAAATATTKAGEASTSATTASSAATTAVNVGGRFITPKASDPSTRDGGGALVAGDQYLNTTSNLIRQWNGASWLTSSSTLNVSRAETAFTATGGQTTFSVTYDVGFLDVFFNGVKLVNTTDFTATNGTSVVLAAGAASGDRVIIVSYGSFVSANMLGKSQNLSDLADKDGALANLGGGTAGIAAFKSVTAANLRSVAGLGLMAVKDLVAFADIAPAAVRLSSEGYTSPLDTELVTALWAATYADSAVLGLFSGGAGKPRIQADAFPDFAVGAVEIINWTMPAGAVSAITRSGSNGTTTSDNLFPYYAIKAGTLRYSVDVRKWGAYTGGADGFSVYKNGTLVSKQNAIASWATYTIDFTFAAGDLITVGFDVSSATTSAGRTEYRNLRLLGDQRGLFRL